MTNFYVNKINAWAPNLETMDDWKEWVLDRKEISFESLSPKLKHLPPSARRRISQISKMVLEVGHQLSLDQTPRPIILSSKRGEVGQQNNIITHLIEHSQIRPAAFSLSVFNTPSSLLSIHEKNTSEQINLFAGDYGVYTAFTTLLSELKTSENQQYLVIFADEYIPEVYHNLIDFDKIDLAPYAFGFIVSKTKISDDDLVMKLQHISGSSQDKSSQNNETQEHPLDLLRWLLDQSYNLKSTLNSQISFFQDDNCISLSNEGCDE